MSTTTSLKLPLRYVREGGDNVIRDSEHRAVIADTEYYPLAPDDPDAYRYIVTACNLHDELVAALKRLLFEVDDDGITQDGVDAALAVLAKAEGGA